jgi:hypothetical protein
MARKQIAWRGVFGQAKLTAQKVLSIRFVASMGYTRLDLAVLF